MWSTNEDDNFIYIYIYKAGFKQKGFGEKILSNAAQKVNCKSNGK